MSVSVWRADEFYSRVVGDTPTSAATQDWKPQRKEISEISARPLARACDGVGM